MAVNHSDDQNVIVLDRAQDGVGEDLGQTPSNTLLEYPPPLRRVRDLAHDRLDAPHELPIESFLAAGLGPCGLLTLLITVLAQAAD